jgi:ATP/maltotriose-dependent transcriptional regulator MalT
MGNYDEAKRHFQASYTLRQEFDDPEGKAVALNHLGAIAYLQADYNEAKRLYAESLDVYQDINDRGGRARSLEGLGRVACARRDYEAARTRLGEALDIAYEIEFWPLVFSLLLDASDLLLRTGSPALGIELLALVQQHPRSDHETTAQAGERLARWQEKADDLALDGAAYDDALARGKGQDLAAAVTRLQTALSEPLPAPDAAAGPEPPLAEPLTEREQEVLRLLAAGYTNPEIAEELVIALGTVKWYASEIYGKLGVSNRTEAAARAREVGLLP